MTEAEVQERVRTADLLTTHSPLDLFRLPTPSGARLDLADHSGIVEFSPADQVVVVKSGTRLSALQSELAIRGQTIPHLFPPILEGADSSLFALIDYNVPHLLEAQCGSWRDWVLGLRVVLADGSVRVCGSKAVKNVAGYDVQKLLIGARGTLGIVTELTLRTYPLRALPAADAVHGIRGGDAFCVQRCLRTRFDEVTRCAGANLICGDLASSTVWAAVDQEHLPRQEGEWLIRAGCGERNLVIEDSALVALMKRAKSILDPAGKLNPGCMGVC